MPGPVGCRSPCDLAPASAPGISRVPLGNRGGEQNAAQLPATYPEQIGDNDSGHPLDQPHAKLTRAAQHLHALTKHSDRIQRTRSSLEARYVSDAHAFDLVLRTGEYPPLFLELILGDFVQNLRSALDFLAWQLVADSDPDALEDEGFARQIQFPIHDAVDGFARSETVQRVGQRSRELMERFQPFQNLQEGTHLVNPLSILQAMSSVDKHRVLIPALGKVQLDNIEIHSTVALDVAEGNVLVETSSVVGDETAICRIPVLGSVPADASVKPRFREPPSVEFPVEAVGMMRLDQFSDLLAQITEVVEAVGSVFPQTGDLEGRMQLWVTPPFDG